MAEREDETITAEHDRLQRELEQLRRVNTRTSSDGPWIRPSTRRIGIDWKSRSKR